MKHKLLTFAGALALLAVLGKYYATPMLAQVRAALVQDVDNAARHFVQVSFLAHVPIGQTSTGLCNDIYTVPNNQRLVIDNFGIRTAITADINLVTITQTLTTSPAACGTTQHFATSTPVVLLPPIFEGFDTRNFRIYGNNQRLQVYADAGQVVSVELDTNNAIDNGTLFFVTMSGHLVSFP
jgi:hypothetical protein